MDKTLAQIRSYLRDVASFALPKYKELPGVDLYMEQVLAYVNGVLSSIGEEKTKALTSFMVNNYVKAGLLDKPTKKRYSRDQIGYLIAISLMKATVSMGDMKTFIAMDAGISKNKEKLYRFFSDVESDILASTSAKVSKRVDEFASRYASSGKSEEDKEMARDALGLLAVRLAIQAAASKLLSDYIIHRLGESMDEESQSTKI